MDVQLLLLRLKLAPAGFSFCDIGEWLQDVLHIDHIEDIRPLFFEDLSRKDLLALVCLLKNRYINNGPADDLFGGSYACCLNEQGVEDRYQSLSLYQEESEQLDFSHLSRLEKLVVGDSKVIESIIFPVQSQLEAVELKNLAVLSHVEGVQLLKHLRFLTVSYCLALHDFSFISSLKELLWLDLTDNSQLTSLDFLSDEHAIVVLQLLGSEQLDIELVSEQLQRLKYLKYLTISGTQKEVDCLRKALPYCVVNGMSALNKAPSLSLERAE